MQKDDKMQALIRCFVPVTALLFCAEGLLRARAVLLYALCSIPALAVLALLVWRCGLLRRKDFRLLLAFPLLAWISSLHHGGLTAQFFLSKFFCVWWVLLLVYCAGLTAKDRETLLERFTLFSVAGFSALQLLVLVYASRSLLGDPPSHDMVFGCFLRGRLTALGNTNYLGFSAAALLFLSVFGLLQFPRGRRAPFVLGAILGWFNLGLSNCRTGIVGFSAAIGLLCFISFCRDRSLRSVLIGALLALLAAGSSVLLLYLPLLFYRAIMGLLALLLHDSVLEENLKTLYLRLLTDDDGTLSSRTLIWARCLEEVFRSPRRALLGVSSLDTGMIPSVYPGHHEIITPHAHNEVLELLHRFGLLGLGIWLALFAIWCLRGVRLLFNSSQPLSLRFLSAAAAGILVMGIAEPLPYDPAGPSFLGLFFLLICGVVMRERRQDG